MCSCQDRQTELWDEAESLENKDLNPGAQQPSAGDYNQVQEVVNTWFLEQLKGASTTLKGTCAVESCVNTMEIVRAAKTWGKCF